MGMNRSKYFLVLAFVVVLFACEKEGNDSDDDQSGLTTNTGNLGSSHNTGKNCLDCHRFSVGGSVYKKDLTSVYPGSVVKLTTQANEGGTVVATITTDNSGNIHTSSAISFGTGLYVSVKGSAGTKYMTSAITSGGCNACHGNSVSKVWTE